MKKMFFILLFLASFLTTISFADDSPFVRNASLNSDGSKIAFSYQGDIWTVNSDGGRAVRITIHEAYDGNPHWSSDDKSIAFNSSRYGNSDLFVIPAMGGIPNRLTYRSSNDLLYDWGNDDNLYFSTSREFQQVEWDHEINHVSAKGGTPQLSLNSVGEMPAVSPNGRFIAFAQGWGRVTRQDYRGPANFDIWIYDRKTDTYSKVTKFDGNDIYPKWGSDNTLYYLSSSSGAYNVNKITLDEKGKAVGTETAVTNYSKSGIREFNVSRSGNKLILERETDVHLVDLSTLKTNKVNIQISADYRFDPEEWKTFSSDVDQYSLSPNGKYVAFVIRGEIFVTENDKEKSLTKNVTHHPYRDQYPVWLSDSTLVFASDREGQNELYILKSADKNQSDLFKTFKYDYVRLTRTDADESYPEISPDLKRIAYCEGKGKLITADISLEKGLSNQTEVLNGWAEPENVSWSPDSKWLAYSLTDLNFNDEIYIHAADNSTKPVNVSMHPRGDYSPNWSADGKKLAFASNRGANNSDVWFVWLNKKDWDKTKEDWEESDTDASKEKKKDKDKDSAKVEPVTIDFENIYERLVQVTNLPGNEYSPVVSKDGETIYFVGNSNSGKGNDLFSIKWDGKELKSLTSGGENPSKLSHDTPKENLYMLKGGKISKYDLKGNKSEGVAFSAKMKINYALEREQIFEEAWRALNEGFYDPDFHGKDWEKLKVIYKPWCLQASTVDDFQEMFNWMLGELNASHMGMRNSSDRAETQKESTGLLGIAIEPTADGVKIVRVIPNSPADREESKLAAGDIITAVNGSKLSSNVNYYSIFTNTANTRVLLSVKNNKGVEREVVIRPTNSLNSELYDEWVQSRKVLVDKYSNGRLGYLHIQGMSMPSFERFEREFTARGFGKEGIVIDVRYNGGGWTTDYLMTVLNYKQHAYTIPRGAAKNLEKENKKFSEFYPLGERLPFAAWTKPSIALCNQNSYSNAEIFSHAYKTLGIGTLVGVPTFGAVISTGARGLIDGSFVRMPGRGWYVKATGLNMENGPAVPDIIIYNQPDSKSKGEDEQLKSAVETLIKQLDN
ncbi:MAG: PDZ domain-containing protein [Bacteroidetes bacterium]|nr:PDZ domain-containing protein [Bacteroidota bacterium]